MLLIDTYSCSQTHEDNMDGNSLKLPCPSATKIGANHTAHSRLPQSARTAPALHITKFSRSSTSLPLPLKRHPHQSCVSLLTHRQKASPLFRHILANEKFGVIFTFARHLAQPGELWPLPVRACHESPFMVALGIRKLSPPATRKSFLVVLAMGAGAKIVCAAFLRGTITLVQYAAYFGCSFFACYGWGRGSLGYHSILITLAKQAVHLFSFNVSSVARPSRFTVSGILLTKVVC